MPEAAAQTPTAGTPATLVTPPAGGDAAKPEVTSIITAPTDGADKKPDAKPGGDPAAKPDDKPYALEVPKELAEHLDKAGLEKFTAFAKETGISLEHANKLLKFDLERRAAHVKSQDESVGLQSKAWLDEVTKDKELGGEKLKETLASVGRAYTKYGPKGLGEELKALGMENHPGLVRWANAVGADLAEDTGGLPGGGGGGAARRESIYDPH